MNSISHRVLSSPNMFLLNKEHLFTSGKSCDNAQYEQSSCEIIYHKKDALCFDDS